MSKRRQRKYIGAYRDEQGRIRPITARTGSSSVTGIPLRLRRARARIEDTPMEERAKLMFVDPMIWHHRTSFIYIYDTIPKSVWSKWKHVHNDPLYDGREFEKYAQSRYNKYSGKFDIVNELKKKVR